MTDDLTHLDSSGRANMVDVGDKQTTARRAVAVGQVFLSEEARRAVAERTLEKGEALAVARVAGISGAKKTPDLIPLCHQIPLDKVSIEFEILDDPSSICIRAEARCHGQTGVEMEALTAVSTAALTLYDMCKAIDRAMRIGRVQLLHKSGGQSGSFDHPDPPAWTQA